MGSLMASRGAGPPDGKLALSGRVEGARVLHLAGGLLTVAKGQTWQTVLALLLVLLASTAAHNEEYSTASYQTVPGTSPDYLDFLPFQNTTERSPQAEEALKSPSTDSHSAGGNLYTGNTSASSVGTAGQFPISSTGWNLNKVSGSLKLRLGGQGPLSGESLDVQSSPGLTLATSLLAAAVDTTAGLSSRELQRLEINTSPSSLPLQVVQAERMEQAHTTEALPMRFLTLPSSATSRSLHLVWNMTHQAALAQEISLNTVSAADQPSSATVLTLESSSPSEHITGIEPGLHGPWLSSAQTVHGIGADQQHGDESGTVPSAETPGYWDRLKEPPHLQSSGSPDAVSASHADLTPRMSTTAVGTTNQRMKRSTLSLGATALSRLVSMPRMYASILSVPTPQSFDASSETTIQQISGLISGQEFDIAEPATMEPLSRSSIWSSSSQFEAPTHVALVKSPGFTDSRKTKESSTHWPLEPLRADKSSWPTPVPVTVESPNMSSASAVNGSHASAENFTEASLRSVSHYGRSLTTGPSSHGFSSVDAPTSSLTQPAVAESTLQDSQWSETTSGLPSGNASLPAIFNSSKASTDMANVSVGQLAVGAATYVPHSFAEEMTDFGPSPATAGLELDSAAVGAHTEASLFIGHPSSISTEQPASSDLTSLSMLPSYLGSAKEQEGSPAPQATPSTFTGERSKLELKEGSHLEAGKYTSPSEASTQVAVLSGTAGTSFLPRQTFSHPPLYSRGETKYLRSWAPSAESTSPPEASPPKGMTITAHHRVVINTELHEQTQAAAEPMPTILSELSLAASEGTPVTEWFSSLASAEPEVQSTHNVLSRQGSEATQLPPHDSTYLDVSQSSELKVSSVAKKSRSPTGHMTTAGSPPLPSYPSFVAAETTPPVGIAPNRTEYTGLVTGGSTDGVPVKLFSLAPSDWKVADLTQLHATVASAISTEAERSSVAPIHSFVPPGLMSSGSPSNNVSESTTEALKGLMARREWIMPASTMLSSTSNTEVQRPDLRASTTSTTYKVAPFLSTGSMKMVTSTSAVTTEAVLGYKATGSFTEATGTTTASLMVPTAQAVPGSTKVVSGTLSSTLKSISSTVPALITPLQSTSAWLSTSEPLMARTSRRHWLVNFQKNMSAVSSTKVPSPEETSTTLLITSTKMGTEDIRTSKQQVPIVESQTLSQSTERESLTSSSPKSHIIAMRTLPLQFRLTGIDYTESLENKSSNSYKKLEKEVKLTLNKMLSSYENLLYSNVLHFLNGSVIVESEVVFQGGALMPTPSDVIRTIVTEIERRRMDTFFDWRVDLKSLQSDGFSLENLEPELLTVFFTVLGSTAAFGDLTGGDLLERLRSEVILLLGTRYQVQDFVLDQVGNCQGDLDVTGEAYINTSIHVDISWVLEALRGLVNYSVDLSTLSVSGSRLGLQVFPFSFLVTNREVSKELLDRSSLEHKTLARDISDVLKHILKQYKNFLQVRIREITGGSLICHGNVIFQHPAPSSKDVLKTLSLAIGPKDYLAESSLQVDPFSFTVAGDGLDPPFTRLGVPGYGVALIVMCALAIIAVPVLNLLLKAMLSSTWKLVRLSSITCWTDDFFSPKPKILGRKDKIIITRAGDLEAGVETFELNNPGFHSTVEAGPGVYGIVNAPKGITYMTCFVNENLNVWKPSARTVPPARQPYGPSLPRANAWAEVDVSQPRALSDLTPVRVKCGEAQVVVTVNRDLFGTGRLVQAADLTLGSPGCEYTSVDAAMETVLFEAGLHECGSTLQLYNLCGREVDLLPPPDEWCLQLETTIDTYLPDDWSAERPSNRYHLGDTMNIQADVHTENHVALRLFIDNCVATLSPDRDSAPQYSIIDFNGCLIDGRLDDSTSAFVSPRITQDSLQFTVDAFRFSGDDRDLIYITCHLKVTAADQSPDPLNKACSYNKARNTWLPVEGTGDTCRCCEARNCGQSQRTPFRRRGSGGRFRRDAAFMHGNDSTGNAETDLMVGPVILEAQKTSVHSPEDRRTEGLIAKGASELVVHIMIGLTIATALFTLVSVSLMCFVAGKKRSRPNT
ncbi:hypothetical protein lerEdw1_008397 [Lerista edwardsae]|nr:hypothetical protein lerEdw1_008397 [Lerista edwardsae]